MKTTRIAGLICTIGPQQVSARQLLCPPWLDDGPDDAIACAFRQVAELRRQRDELNTIFPAKKGEHQDQFNDLVMELAADLYEKLQPDYEP